ncbi:hypothetical protein HBH64_065970 [Parastagonospora nodorum]|nr:hypothetical protein HBH52_045060 [Parastagonospora nodorum]KAH4123368.1 hypothetical protein HBH47_074920 [Parastagonospora nodorum]KAH4309428.1 hypothetical protein HBI01_035850 [Parastagonospora nodorum]KAH4314664.1 hypothetical protein HBI02_062930 [Parastagonospora nodorum]KAH4335032.1 hypothetical protein HBI00_034010 [Parastagonospora nodorum]
MTSILKSSITAIQLNHLEHQPPSHRFINHVECHQGHDLSLTFNSFSWSSPASAPPPCNATTSNKLLHFFSSLAGGFGSGQTGLLMECRFKTSASDPPQAPELPTTLLHQSCRRLRLRSNWADEEVPGSTFGLQAPELPTALSQQSCRRLRLRSNWTAEKCWSNITTSSHGHTS